MLVNSLIFCNLTCSWSVVHETLHIRCDPYISRYEMTGSSTVIVLEIMSLVRRSMCPYAQATEVA